MELDIKQEEPIWAQKYRPRRVADTILPETTKAIFQKFIDDRNVPNLLLSGSPGTGKTTSAIAMLEELGCDYIKINGSLNAGIDVIRNDIASFASSVSFSGGRKYVIIDEADYLSPQVQASLRSFIEDFSKNCGFIFTCNHKNRIMGALRDSRFTTIHFQIEKEEKPKLAAQFFKRSIAILKNESIEFDPKVVAKLIEKFFPDFRRILGELQKYAAIGNINEGIFSTVKSESIDDLFVLLKDKNFTEMRKWVANNSDQDMVELFRKIFDASHEKIELKSMISFVSLIGRYQYQHALVADPEINFVAFLAELMVECSFK